MAGLSLNYVWLMPEVLQTGGESLASPRLRVFVSRGGQRVAWASFGLGTGRTAQPASPSSVKDHQEPVAAP